MRRGLVLDLPRMINEPFSSLLIGMCFATGEWAISRGRSGPLSVPFSSGCALRPAPATPDAPRIPFSSLLIGMCFATSAVVGHKHSGCTSFSSLLIGMCFATSDYSYTNNRCNYLSVPFSSGCALRLDRRMIFMRNSTFLSVPFSSGCALRP